MALVATAFVEIRPALTTFRQDLEREVTAAVAAVKAPPVVVPVELVPTGVVAGDIGKQARREIEQELAGVRAAVAAGGVDLGEVRAGTQATDTAAASLAGSAAANERAAKTKEENTAATKALSAAEKEAADLAAIEEASTTKLSRAQATLNAALAGTISPTLALTEARRASAAAAEREAAAVASGTNVQQIQAGNAARAAASIQQQAQALVDVSNAQRVYNAAVASGITNTSSLAQIHRAAAVAATAQAAAESALGTATLGASRAVKLQAEGLVKQATDLSRTRAEALDVAKQRQSVETLLQKSARQSASIDNIKASSLDDVTKRTLEANAAANAYRGTQQALTLALEIGDEELVERIVLLEKERASALKAAEAEQVRAARVQAGLRGTVAQGLQLLGLRGAALSASGAFLAAAASFIVLAKGVKSTAQLEQELNVFAGTTGATADEMARVSDASKELGADLTLPAVSAGDAANAMTELAKAGLSVEDAIAGARGVLQLATAAQIENAEAATLVANALNAFGLAGEEAVHVADLLANAANAAQGSISDFGAAFSQVSAVARQAGVSLEDTVGLLTLFARNGLRGSDAGTSLRTAFLRLVNPTKEARDVIEELGLQIRDAQGNVNPEVFAQFGQATRNLDPAVRDAAAAIIGGQDAIRAFAIGAREGAEGLAEVRAAMEKEGSAADLAAARSRGLAGAAAGLNSNLETLGNTIVSPFLPAAEQLVKFFADATHGAILLVDGIKKLGGILATPLKLVIDVDTEGEGGESPFKTIEQLRSEMERLSAGAENTRVAINKFFNEDTEPIKAQIQALKAEGVSTKDLEQALKDLEAQRKKALADVPGGEGGGGAAKTPLEKSIERQRDLIAQLEEHQPDLDLTPLRNALRTLEIELARTGERGGPRLLDPIHRATDKIPQLLQSLQANARHLDPLDPLAESARDAVAKIIAQLEALGPEGKAALARSGETLAKAFGADLRAALSDFTGIDDLVIDAAPVAIEKMIRQLAKLGPAGRAVLKRVGQDLTEGLAEGLADERAAVAAAEKTLRDVQASVRQEVDNTIREARGNLESLGTTLAEQVGDIIEKSSGPAVRRIGEEIAALARQHFDIEIDTKEATKNVDTLREALQKLDEQQQGRELQRNIDEAQKALAEAQASIVTFGRITPDQQSAINEFLKPFREDVEDAKLAADKFNLEKQIDQVDKTKTAAAEAAKQGVAKLIDQFESGKISADKFATALRQQLGGAFKALPKANLGLTFTREFMHNFETVVQQAKDLAGFLGRAGTEPGTQSVDIAEVAAQGAERVTAARTALQQSRDELAKQTKKMERTNKLLDLIEKNTRNPKGGGGLTTGANSVRNQIFPAR